jgi:hypothetical protein
MHTTNEASATPDLSHLTKRQQLNIAVLQTQFPSCAWENHAQGWTLWDGRGMLADVGPENLAVCLP